MSYLLASWQESAFDLFMDKFGIDAGVKVMIEFEKHGLLGKAMLDWKKRGGHMIISAKNAETLFREATRAMGNLPGDLQVSVEMDFRAFGGDVCALCWDTLHLAAGDIRRHVLAVDEKEDSDE